MRSPILQRRVSHAHHNQKAPIQQGRPSATKNNKQQQKRNWGFRMCVIINSLSVQKVHGSVLSLQQIKSTYKKIQVLKKKTNALNKKARCLQKQAISSWKRSEHKLIKIFTKEILSNLVYSFFFFKLSKCSTGTLTFFH